MPLFTFKCMECECFMEKFLHNIEEYEAICEECGSIKCERQFSLCGNRVWLDAKDMYDQKIAPDAKRIMDKMGKGNSSDFFDIYGDK